MEPIERFSNRVENYRRYRPSYPAAVIDLIRDTAGLRSGASVADIGSGTGAFALAVGFMVLRNLPGPAFDWLRPLP